MPRSRSRSLESRMPLPLKLGGAELPGLAKHRVDQRRLSMVNVGDDRHVADVIASLHESLVPHRRGGPSLSDMCGRYGKTITRVGDELYTSSRKIDKTGLNDCMVYSGKHVDRKSGYRSGQTIRS